MTQIRECTAEDFDGVVVLLRQLWPDRLLDPSALRSAFAGALSSNGQHFLCAESDRKVVAFGSLTLKRSLWHAATIGYVDEMVVDESHRGRGIGSQLLEQLISWARDQGCSDIELDSALHRKDAHVFYEKRGFEKYAFLYSWALR
jgi:GNAT superfamily N-acetyltransferase